MKLEKEPNQKSHSPTLNWSTECSKNIRSRRSIYANEFIKGDLPDELLTEILVNATWAPSHKMTEPWRFIVFRNEYLVKYGEYMENYYQDLYRQTLSAEALKEKLSYLRRYPLNAACIIGVILVRNRKVELPEWEEIAAISAAVQNIALTCTANNIGSYWSTKPVAIDYLSEYGLDENERSLGLLYLGYYPNDLKLSKKKRTPLSKKVIYLP